MNEDILDKYEGMLPCGLWYLIEKSRKKAPGLVEGEHLVAVFRDLVVPIPHLPPKAFLELSFMAHEFAIEHVFYPGGYRIAYNGPGVGRRNHAHIHIMLPKGNDKLPSLVMTSDGVI